MYSIHPLIGFVELVYCVDFEGGTRQVAFASGGWLPQELRGTASSELLHVADMWATFSSLAGDPDPTHDARTTSWNTQHPDQPVPPPDSFDASAVFLRKGGQSGRHEIPLSVNALIAKGNSSSVNKTTPLYKIVVGVSKKAKNNFWTPPQFPFFDSNDSKTPTEKGQPCEPLCVFDVASDPTEHHDLYNTSTGAQIASQVG